MLPASNARFQEMVSPSTIHQRAHKERNLKLQEISADVRIYSYVIEHDLGFAPNPFHLICTLAACKPQIRRSAQVGDYIIGTGAKRPNIQGHLSYWMRVDEILTFEQYWDDPRFRLKRPFMRGSYIQRYGDNIYHRDPFTGEIVQEDSFHSKSGGKMSIENLVRDTGTTDRVLIAAEFAYWGGAGPKIPSALKDFVVANQGHKCRFNADRVQAFLSWLSGMPGRGYLGEPAHWQFL